MEDDDKMEKVKKSDIKKAESFNEEQKELSKNIEDNQQ